MNFVVALKETRIRGKIKSDDCYDHAYSDHIVTVDTVNTHMKTR